MKHKKLNLFITLFIILAFVIPIPAPKATLADVPQATAALPFDNETSVNWCIAGDINGWNNSSTPLYDDGTNGDILPGDGVYSTAMTISTAGTYLWKAVECGNWSLAYPAANSWLITTATDQVVTFTLDTNDYSGNAGMALLPAANIVNVTGDTLPTSFTAVGDFQGWNNADPTTLMTDMGNGFYRLVYTIPTAGSYIGKVVNTGSWNGFGADGRSSDAANINFTTTEANQQVVFLLDSYTGRLHIDVVSSGTGTWCAAGGFNGWEHSPLFDDGTNGDLLGGDGVFMADITIPTTDRYEWKVTSCTWDVSYPSANSWFITSESDQVVKLSFDTNDHSTDVGLDMVPKVNILHAWDSSNSFTAVGSFQGWDNANPATALTGLGYGLYLLNAAISASGAYEYKVVATGTWDAIGSDNRSVNAANIPFTTYTDGDVVPFLLDYRTGRVGAFPPPPPTNASHDNEVWWDELGHNSRDTLFRTPGGPVTTGTPVTLRLRAASGDLTEAKVRVWNDRTDTQLMLPMSIAYDDGTYEWWEVVVPASSDPTVYWYRFFAIDGTDTDYYEDDTARTGGWGEAFDESQDNSYQLTVYDPAYETPDWIKNAVVYQVFPDRFRDGDPVNNKEAGTFFYNEEGGTVYRSLDAEGDWNTAICDPREADDCAGTYSKNFYGGDLAGLIEKLDYIQTLGVNTIYLNPIFESPSNHGYDTTDYMAINPMFGTQEEFETLVTELQNRGMYLILDGVFNHVSSDSIYFDRYSNFESVGACESETSPYRDWFYFTEVPAGTGPCVGDDGTPGGANYESWWGYDSLPKMQANNPEVRALVWDNASAPEETVAGYWMQFADGWRLDVGADVDPGTINDPSNDYWEGFRDTVKTVNPEGYITGEEWGIANAWLLGGEWDAVMNYQFSSAVLSLWRDETFEDNDHNAGSSAGALAPLTPQAFDERILNLMERYSPEAFAAMLNLFGSHDTSRALFMLDHNTDLGDPSLYENPAYDWSDAIERLKGAVLVQMTMPGAPTIYYGDEIGLVGPMAYAGGKWEDDPYNRQPYPWLDEDGTPFYSHLQTQTEQDALYNYYALLTDTRNTHPALRTGDYRTLIIDNDNEIYAYGRHIPGEDAAVIIINRNDSTQYVTIDVSGYLPEGANFEDVIGSTTYAIDPTGLINFVEVPANSGVILVLADETLASPPEVILDLSVTGTSGTTVDLDWTATTGATNYLVYRSYLSGGGYTYIGETANTSYTDTGLTPGQTVYYIVIAENLANGLLSEQSNEVEALPAYIIGWANLQWPPSITHTISSTPTENIYGQVWIDGVTSLTGATPGLWAQVGFGPDGSLPESNSEWIWVDTTFNGDNGNNDEFMGALTPEQLGTYDYAYRYSTNLGASWLYADLTGTGDGYSPDNAGQLIVNASADVTPPSSPVLSIADWGAGFIEISWAPATDDIGVYGYEVYRTDGDQFAKIARVLEPTLSYRDETVETGVLYFYLVKAIDTSFNLSSYSNAVHHVAEAKMVSVTIDVIVPDITVGTVYVVGNHPSIGDWNPGSVALTKVDDFKWSITLDILDGTSLEFKFTRGSWDTVMKGADGDEELANLTVLVQYGDDGTQLFEYTVLNWRDPIVTAYSPLDGATDVTLDVILTTTWNQEMASDACFVLTGPEGTVAGTCSYDALSKTISFTPSSPLLGMTTYTVTVSGLKDANNDTQQVPLSWMFTTMPITYYLPLITN